MLLGIFPQYGMSILLSVSACDHSESTLLLPVIFSLAFPPNFPPGYQPISFLLTNKSNIYSQWTEGLLQSRQADDNSCRSHQLQKPSVAEVFRTLRSSLTTTALPHSLSSWMTDCWGFLYHRTRSPSWDANLGCQVDCFWNQSKIKLIDM